MRLAAIRRSGSGRRSSLPDVLPDDVEHDLEPDPYATQERLASASVAVAPWSRARRKPREVIKTALVVEVRDGHLRVFVPPVRKIDPYAALIGAIEETARELAAPVLVEGYPPPRIRASARCSSRPDPGVIEVNVHPSSTWRGLIDTTWILY
jgi:uncharacterized protein (DUF2126 family)